MVRDRNGRPPTRPAWRCTAPVCRGGALLADLTGVSRSRECDLFDLSIYPRILLRVFIVSSLIRVSCCVVVFYYVFICVSCFGLVVSTCQVIDYRKAPLMTPS